MPLYASFPNLSGMWRAEPKVNNEFINLVKGCLGDYSIESVRGGYLYHVCSMINVDPDYRRAEDCWYEPYTAVEPSLGFDVIRSPNQAVTVDGVTYTFKRVPAIPRCQPARSVVASEHYHYFSTSEYILIFETPVAYSSLGKICYTLGLARPSYSYYFYTAPSKRVPNIHIHEVPKCGFHHVFYRSYDDAVLFEEGRDRAFPLPLPAFSWLPEHRKIILDTLELLIKRYNGDIKNAIYPLDKILAASVEAWCVTPSLFSMGMPLNAINLATHELHSMPFVHYAQVEFNIANANIASQTSTAIGMDPTSCEDSPLAKLRDYIMGNETFTVVEMKIRLVYDKCRINLPHCVEGTQIITKNHSNSSYIIFYIASPSGHTCSIQPGDCGVKPSPLRTSYSAAINGGTDLDFTVVKRESIAGAIRAGYEPTNHRHGGKVLCKRKTF